MTKILNLGPQETLSSSENHWLEGTWAPVGHVQNDSMQACIFVFLQTRVAGDVPAPSEVGLLSQTLTEGTQGQQGRKAPSIPGDLGQRAGERCFAFPCELAKGAGTLFLEDSGRPRHRETSAVGAVTALKARGVSSASQRPAWVTSVAEVPS